MNANALQAIDPATDDRLPAPETEEELQERMGLLEDSITSGEWEGAVFTPDRRDLLKRYALGQIGLRQFRAEIAHGV